MNRASLRSLVQRQLNDVAAHDFDDPAVNDALDHGSFEALKIQLAILPDSVKAIATADMENGDEFYLKPTDAWQLYKVQTLQDGVYKTIEKRDYDQAEQRVEGSELVTWSHFGRYIALRPIPTADLTAGIRYLYVPSGAMSNDNDTPVVHLGLHRLVFLEACLALLPETGEAAKELRDARDRIVGMAASWLRQDIAEPDRFVPQIDKQYPR